LPPVVSIPTAAPTPTNIPQTVSLGLMGDLGLGRFITSTARAKNDFNWSFSAVSPWLLSHDFNLANLESPVIETGTFTFCGDSRFTPVLEKYNFVFNLNNNHILNYGEKGLKETQNILNNVPHFYDNFLVKKVNGITFGFLGFDFITYPNQDKDSVIAKIKKYAPDVDYLIISIHWGNEYLPKPETWRVNLAHAMIDAGADIIHGQHPHVWQGYEMYQNKPIFYSFGNFIFDQSWSYETSHSQVVTLTLSKNTIEDLKLFPVEIKYNSQPRLVNN